MKKLWKGTGVAMIALTLMNSTVLADPLGDKLQSQQQQLKQDKSQLQSVQDKLDNMEQNTEMLDDQIGSTTEKIDANNKLIASIEKDIHNAEEEIKASKVELEKSNAQLDVRVRATYKNGTVSYLALLLGSNSIGDFISRVESIERIINYDNKLIADIKAKKREINNKKETLQNQKEKLVALNKENGSKMASLNTDREKQKSLAEDLKKQERIVAANVSASQDMVNATLDQIAPIRKDTPKFTLSRGAAPISDNAVIAFASNFLGTPYVWGGTTPVPGFDCSGFTRYVYAHFGIHLGRTTYDQIKNGVQVSRDQLKPGDLVFFGTWSNPHHMGIYVGNNTYIHAPHTGDMVKISTMSRGDYVTARRVM